MALATTGLKKARKKYDAQGKLIRARPVIKKPEIKKPTKKKTPPPKIKKKPGTPQHSTPWNPAPGSGGSYASPNPTPVTGPINYIGGPTKPKKKPGGPKPKPKPKPPGKAPVRPRPVPPGAKAPPKKRGGYGGYVDKYPDLAKAYKKHKKAGGKSSAAAWGKKHYEKHGKKEKRKLS